MKSKFLFIILALLLILPSINAEFLVLDEELNNLTDTGFNGAALVNGNSLTVGGWTAIGGTGPIYSNAVTVRQGNTLAIDVHQDGSDPEYRYQNTSMQAANFSVSINCDTWTDAYIQVGGLFIGRKSTCGGGANWCCGDSWVGMTTDTGIAQSCGAFIWNLTVSNLPNGSQIAHLQTTGGGNVQTVCNINAASEGLQDVYVKTFSGDFILSNLVFYNITTVDSSSYPPINVSVVFPPTDYYGFTEDYFAQQGNFDIWVNVTTNETGEVCQINDSNFDLFEHYGGDNVEYTQFSNPIINSNYGYYGSGMFTDGNDYIDSPYQNLSFSSFTASFWIKTNKTTGKIFSQYSTDARIWEFFHYNNLVYFKTYHDCSSTNNTGLPFAPITPDTWTYLTAIWNRSGIKLYINGVFYDEINDEPGDVYLCRNERQFRVGESSGGGLNGTLDELKIYNRTLTQAEIQAEMNNHSVWNATGLKLYIAFDNSTHTFKNNTAISSGEYSDVVYCNLTGTSNGTATINFIVDPQEPTLITNFINNTMRFMQNLTGDFNMSDNLLLHAYNITIDGVQLDGATGLGVSNYQYNLTYNVSGLSFGKHNLSLRVTDGHTDNELRKDYNVYTGLFDDYIQYTVGAEVPVHQYRI